LFNNQPLEKFQTIGQELQKSQNIENKTIGEVLQTFARAEISQAENKTNITIKLPENGLVSTETYRELLEKFYPDDTRENEKYKFENLGEKEVLRAREKGQDDALESFREEIKSNVYQKDDSDKVIEIETAVHEKLDKIAQFQSEARNALRENERLTNKYVARANAKMQTQNQGVPSLINQKKIVSAALGVKSLNLDKNKANDQFLQAVQKEITVTDLNKFTANENFLGEMKANIKNEFSEISGNLKVLEENRSKLPKAIEPVEKAQIISEKITNQEISENKPLSLRIFEKELEKTEKQMLGESLKEKLTANADLEKNFDPKTVFSIEERTEIKSKAIEAVKEKLEPKELNMNNRQISPEASRQAFVTYKQLGKATNLWQTGDDKSKITEAFSKLDREAAKLNQIRQDYNRNEKLALLRDGIKTDLMDWLKKNPDSKQNNFEGQVNKILMNNFNKTEFVKIASDGKQIGILSRQITEKIEAKQFFAANDKGISADSRESVNSAKNHYSGNNDRSKTNLFEKVKDAPVLTR
jgi:hypothetical protein